MNKVFEEWCSQECDDKVTDEEIIDTVEKEIFPLLNYNQRHISDDDIAVSFDRSINALVFDNVQSFELDRTNGQCLELAEKTLKLIRMRFPEFAERFEVVIGQEPNYFSQYMSQHYFLAEKSDYIDDPSRIIIDPSFSKIGPADLLGYFVNGKCNNNEDLTLLEGQLTPYTFLSDDLLLFGWLRQSGFDDLDMIVAIQKINERIQRTSFPRLHAICKKLNLEEILIEVSAIRRKINNVLFKH